MIVWLSWQWHRTGSSWSPVRTLPVAPLWCDWGFVTNSSGNKAAVNLRPKPLNHSTIKVCSSAAGQGLGTLQLEVRQELLPIIIHSTFRVWAPGACRSVQVKSSSSEVLNINLNPSTFPNENVKLRRTVTPGCLFFLDEKFSEQLQCLKSLLNQNLSVTFFRAKWALDEVGTSFWKLCKKALVSSLLF